MKIIASANGCTTIPRTPIRHSLASVVAVATASALAGASSFDAIGQFAGQLPQEVLAKLDCRWHEGRQRFVTPSPDTIGRCLTRLDADRLDQIVGRRLYDQGIRAENKDPEAAEQSPSNKRTGSGKATTDERDPLVGIAVDGKWLRGSGCVEPDMVKLFSGMLQNVGAVIGQTQVGDDSSTCELNSMRPLLRRLGDLCGKVITADALHCQVDHALAIVDDHHGEYFFGVKNNQPGVLKAVEAIPDGGFGKEHVTTNRGTSEMKGRSP